MSLQCLLLEEVVVEMLVMKEIFVMKCRVERCWLIFDLEEIEREHLNGVVVSIVVRCC